MPNKSSINEKQKYHTVEATPTCNRKIVIEAKSIPLTHIYITAHFRGLVQKLLIQGCGIKLV